MTIRLSDLTPMQIQLLACLDDGFPHEDSIGRPMREISDRLLMEAAWLAKRGLIEASFGWRGACYLRLTEAGRQL